MNSFLLNEYNNNFWNLDKTIREKFENLNKNKLSNELYNKEFNDLYNFILDKYENDSPEQSQKDYLFDIIIELFLGCKNQLKISAKIYNKFLEKVYEKKYYDVLLKYYKEYDFLNKEDNLIKIFVGYIKPSFLFKSDILTPIHLGRAVEKDASKDGIVSDEDIKWLHYNCIGDDDFDGNISYINRRVGFFTGTYWAWKNYERLDNPKYFGFFGYRRLLFPNCLNRLEDYDLILPIKKMIYKTIKADIIYYHDKDFYEKIINAVAQVYPQELENVTAHFNSCESYFAEMYIMKKDLFFEFCEWMNKILDYILKRYPISMCKGKKYEQPQNNNNLKQPIQNIDRRDIAFVIERLTGYYLLNLTKNKNLKYKEVNTYETQILSIRQNILDQLRQNIIKDLKND